MGKDKYIYIYIYIYMITLYKSIALKKLKNKKF